MLDRLSRVALAATPLLILTVIASAPIHAQQQPPPGRGRLPLFGSEGSMRRRVVSSAMPAYPESSLRAGVQGLAAALVTHDEEGVVIAVKILKAPDESIAASVRDALKRWTFAPPSHGKPQQGTLRFNFSIEGGEGRVEYGSLEGVCYQQPGRQMPDGTIRLETLEDIDTPCDK